MKILISKSAATKESITAKYQPRLEKAKAKLEAATAKYKAEPRTSDKKGQLRTSMELAQLGVTKLKMQLKTDLDKLKAPISKPGTTSAPAPKEDLSKIKFNGASLPTISKTQLDEVVAKLKLTGMKKAVTKLKGKVLRVEPAQKPNTRQEEPPCGVLFWPFPFKKGDSSFATIWGKITKFKVFEYMAGTDGIAEPKAVRVDSFRGHALCRVCGAALGSQSIVGKDVVCPSASVAHYRGHGIKANLIAKTILDKETGHYFRVTYIGKPSDLPDVL